MRRYLILMAVLAFALTACRVESNIILDIEEDGSALVGAELGFDEEFRQLLGDNNVDPDDLFGGLPDLGADDVVQTERWLKRGSKANRRGGEEDRESAGEVALRYLWDFAGLKPEKETGETAAFRVRELRRLE